MAPRGLFLVIVPSLLIGCSDRQVCLAIPFDDCCPNETIAAAEGDLGVSAGHAFRAWRDLTFEGQSDNGPQTVSVALDRRVTRSEGYQPAGEDPPGGATMESFCDVGLVFEVAATATLGSDEVRGLWGLLTVADDTTLMLMSDPGAEDCGCNARIDAVLETGPASEQVVGGSFEVDCPGEDSCPSGVDDLDASFGDGIDVAW